MGRVFVPDRRDWLRLVGGVVFAVGAVVLVARKGGVWSNFATLVTLFVPTVVLLGAGFAAPRGAALAWRSAYLIAGVLLVPAFLLQFVNWIGGTPGDDLNLVWIFGVTAAVAIYAATRYEVPYTVLVAALAVIVSWLSLWDKIIGSPSADTVRWLLLAIGAIYVLLAAWRRRDPWHTDLVTGAGVAFVATGAITLVTVLGVSIVESVFGSSGLDAVRRAGSKPSDWWTISLLLEGIGLVSYAASTRRRGPGYVGAAALAVFAAIAGINIDALFSGDSRSTVAGWPLVLLIGGGLLIVFSFVLRPGALDEVGVVHSAPPPPDGPPPT